MIKNCISLLFAVLIFSACTNQVQSEKMVSCESGELLDDIVQFEYIVYFESDSLPVNNDIAAYTNPLIPVYDDSWTEGNALKIEIFGDIYDDGSTPDMGYVQALSEGFLSEDFKRYEDCDKAVILTFTLDNHPSFNNQEEAARIVYKIAAAFDGYIEDLEARIFYTPDSFSKIVLESWDDNTVVVMDNISMHQYQDDDYLRTVTLGMSKFGLPDIVVQQTTRHHAESIGSIVNIICQTLIENPELSINGSLPLDMNSLKDSYFKRTQKDGLISDAKGRGVVFLEHAETDLGDADNALWAVSFKDYSKDNIFEKQSAFLADFFGSSDSVINTTHDEALLKASEEAKKKLPAIQKYFNQEFGLNEVLYVKAPFVTDDGGNEWMWVEVVSWEGDTIKGILQNDPYYIADLKSGMEVTVYQGDLFDYILYRADGSTEGNETGRIIQEMN